MSIKFNPLTGNFDLVNPAGAGTGDVQGPASAVNDNIVVFDGISGKDIKDSGISIDEINDTANALQDHIEDGTGAHDSGAISVNPTFFNILTGTDQFTINQEIDAILTTVPVGNSEDIPPGQFDSITNNVSSPADVTDFIFDGNVKGFNALATVIIFDSLSGELYVETFQILGSHRGNTWSIATTTCGDDSGVTFSITNTVGNEGQIQYTTINYPDFSGLTIKFRAIVHTLF
jgi:hypothetical protein